MQTAGVIYTEVLIPSYGARSHFRWYVVAYIIRPIYLLTRPCQYSSTF